MRRSSNQMSITAAGFTTRRSNKFELLHQDRLSPHTHPAPARVRSNRIPPALACAPPSPTPRMVWDRPARRWQGRGKVSLLSPPIGGWKHLRARARRNHVRESHPRTPPGPVYPLRTLRGRLGWWPPGYCAPHCCYLRFQRLRL